ncbi:MAG TPA: preprotein translocase subunit SecG [Casimicrobiaceae bacterium]|nr:preprotein translocase subunit SecG [Casimicrobiaceae bacterium]
MNLLQSAVLVAHVLAALSVCGFVLLQHGKGADMGAAFGGGSSGSLFGAAGSANFLSRTTAILATVFFVTSITLTWFGSQHGTVPQGVMEKGVMERTLPSKPSDVPGTAGGTQPPAAVPGTAGTTGSPGSTPSEVPK